LKNQCFQWASVSSVEILPRVAWPTRFLAKMTVSGMLPAFPTPMKIRGIPKRAWIGQWIVLAGCLQAAEPPRPLMRDFIGINGHTVQFKPALYQPVCRLVRDYHPVNGAMPITPGWSPPWPPGSALATRG
jgi:hypothetical protein